VARGVVSCVLLGKRETETRIYVPLERSDITVIAVVVVICSSSSCSSSILCSGR